MDKKGSGWGALAGVIFVSLLVLLAAYIGAYYALVATLRAPPRLSDDQLRVVLTPAYRVGGSMSQKLFYPVHQIDRRLRPERWEQALRR